MDNGRVMQMQSTVRAAGKAAAHETRGMMDDVGERLTDRIDTISGQFGGWLMNLGDRLGGSTYYYRRPETAGRVVGLVAGGAVLGAALMYLLDPTGGRRRRALLRDQAVHYAHEAGDAAEATAEDVRNRGRGLLAESRGMFGRRSRGQSSGIGMPRSNWSPAARFIAGLTGGALAAFGISRRDVLGYVLSAVGLGLVTRAVTNMQVTRLTGIGRQGRGIDVHKTIHVQAPVDEVYAFWRDFANFPRFMTHIKEVRDIGSGQSQWVAIGPAGVPVEWKAFITEERPQETLAWQSTPDSEVQNSGRVSFQPNPQGGTQIDVHMAYNPPAGAVGHAVATLLGGNPKQAMSDDLRRFKSLIEEGRTVAERR